MKRNKAFITILSAGLLMSCGGEENTETTDGEAVDSVATDVIDETEESTLAFDGVDAGDYTLFGHSEITADETATVDEMFQEFESTGSFNRTVEVKIDQVCQKAGCWITFLDSDDSEVRVFFRDHFTIPIETPSGTDAVLYGALVMDTMDVDFQKHLLDDAKEAGEEVAQEEYDAITEDLIEVSFDCESILLKK
jgi:hypothetical protein